MDIIDCLHEEHRSVLRLLDRFDQLKGAAARSQLVVELTQVLSIHEQAEAAAVWFALRRRLPDASLVEDALGEEDGVKQVLEDLVMNLEDDQIQAGVRQVRQLLVSHLETEEQQIMPLVRQHLDEAQRARMADAYMRSKVYQVEQMARLNVIMAPEAPIEQRMGGSGR